LLESASENGKDFRATWQNLPGSETETLPGAILIPGSRDMIRDVRKIAVEIPPHPALSHGRGEG